MNILGILFERKGTVHQPSCRDPLKQNWIVKQNWIAVRRNRHLFEVAFFETFMGETILIGIYLMNNLMLLIL